LEGTVSASYEKLFKAVRRQATPQAWSSGVTLAREHKVVKESEEEDSVAFVVLAGGRGKALEVELYPEDLDWQCECPNPADVCEHVAAAVIALHKADIEGEEVPTHRPGMAAMASLSP
jgi:uncharacterized Zn finger protein